MLQTSQVARGTTHAMCDEKTSKELLQELLAKHDKSAQVNFATGGPCSSHSLAEHRPVATPQATLFADHGEPKLPEAEKTHENTPSLEQSQTTKFASHGGGCIQTVAERQMQSHEKAS